MLLMGYAFSLDLVVVLVLEYIRLVLNPKSACIMA
jgi:hypothetical protein